MLPASNDPGVDAATTGNAVAEFRSLLGKVLMRTAFPGVRCATPGFGVAPRCGARLDARTRYGAGLPPLSGGEHRYAGTSPAVAGICWDTLAVGLVLHDPADPPTTPSGVVKSPLGGVNKVIVQHEHQADAHIEDSRHLIVGDAAKFLQP